jgi:hypothetical protein
VSELSPKNDKINQEKHIHSAISQSNVDELDKKGCPVRQPYEKASSIHQMFPESLQIDSAAQARPFQTHISQPRIIRYRSTDRLMDHPLKSSLSVLSVQKYNSSLPKITRENQKKADPSETTKLKVT